MAEAERTSFARGETDTSPWWGDTRLPELGDGANGDVGRQPPPSLASSLELHSPFLGNGDEDWIRKQISEWWSFWEAFWQ